MKDYSFRLEKDEDGEKSIFIGYIDRNIKEAGKFSSKGVTAEVDVFTVMPTYTSNFNMAYTEKIMQLEGFNLADLREKITSKFCRELGYKFYGDVSDFANPLLKALQPKPKRNASDIFFALLVLIIVIASAILLGVYVSMRHDVHRTLPGVHLLHREIKVRTSPDGDTTSLQIVDTKTYLYKTMTHEQQEELKEIIK